MIERRIIDLNLSIIQDLSCLCSFAFSNSFLSFFFREDSLLLTIIEKIIFAVNTILLAGLYLLKSILIANSEINHVTNHSIGRRSLHTPSRQTRLVQYVTCRDKATHIDN